MTRWANGNPMSQDLRASIYQLDYLDPVSNSGYAIDTFYYYSDELAQYPIEQLQVELDAMAAEGLLRQENGKTYWGTTHGKVSRQKYLAQQKLLSKCLIEQRAHSLENLILAIAASAHVDPFSGDESIALDALPIYLNEFSNESVQAATDALIKEGHLRVNEFHPRKAIQITGKGLQKYRADSRIKLDLGRVEGILRLRTPIKTDARFGKLGLDTELQDNLAQRWIDMEACADSKVYLPAVIMLGSILEGALIAKLRANIKAAMTSNSAPKDKGGTVRSLDDWTLAECISVAVNLNYIPRSVEKHSHELRDTRNLVHPRKQVNERVVVDASLYRISKEVAETVIEALMRAND